MELSADELAGVVDLFGALTRSELETAVEELAFKRDVEPPAVDALIDDAVASYHVVEAGPEGDLLAPGPTAFPELPAGARDLPHIMDVPDRDVDRDDLAERVVDRFREEAVVAVRSGNEGFVERLLDVSYEIGTWADADVAGTRSELSEALSEADGD